jgi:hypothetical protein
VQPFRARKAPVPYIHGTLLIEPIEIDVFLAREGKSRAGRHRQ